MSLFMALLPVLWIIGAIVIIGVFLYRAWRSSAAAKRRLEQAEREEA